QSTFNLLTKKIEKLQNSIKEREAKLNKGLHDYHSNVRPLEEKIVEKLSECIPLFYSYYKHPRSKLSKKEREILKELIQSLLGRLGNYMMPQQINSEIADIISDIEGTDFQEILSDQFAFFKEEISSFAAQQGLDIDLSEINVTDSEEELMAKFQSAFETSKNSQEKADIKGMKERAKKKTKQQLKKEQHAREVEEIQKKGLSKIYKELAKALHPDLELDPVIKAEKEALMKKLTLAYENQDLHTLLSLEITWMNRSASNEGDSRFQIGEEQLKIYNAILKDQVKSLEEEVDHLFTHPRYFDMRHILDEYHQTSVIEMLEDEKKQLSKDIERYSLAIIDLKGGSNFKRVKQILKEFSSIPEDIFSDLMKLFLQAS
ncbi:MAG: hypothetical protein ACXWM7_06410, partial [Parachlamydiaceae bacterium]